MSNTSFCLKPARSEHIGGRRGRKMEILQRLDGVIESVSKNLESNPSDSALESFHHMLIHLKNDLSRPAISVEFLRQFSGGLSRMIRESIWADTPLGDEILYFLIELRKYRKQLEEE
jgi:hypothetical protein